MNNKMLATVGAAAFALTMSASVSHATMIAQPGELMGLAFGAPLPEGVYAVDLEDYGRADTSNLPGSTNTGVNIPAIAWSTPWSYGGTRLEFLYAAPFVHRDGGLNRVDYYSQLFGPILAHDFGNGFGASLLLGVRTPDSAFHDYTAADIRAALSYTAGGWDITGTFYYNGTFGGHSGGAFAGTALTGASDAVDVDFTATKKFGKFEFGLVGFAYTDVNTRGDNSITFANGTVVGARKGAVALGGLVGYDFGRFTVQGMVTRQIAERNLGTYETRGWLRVILPLYTAPAPSVNPVIARY